MMAPTLDSLDVDLGAAGIVSNSGLMFGGLAMSGGDEYVRCNRYVPEDDVSVFSIQSSTKRLTYFS
jgi:hypothetical protein